MLELELDPLAVAHVDTARGSIFEPLQRSLAHRIIRTLTVRSGRDLLVKHRLYFGRLAEGLGTR